jgi:hypothetical protein
MNGTIGEDMFSKIKKLLSMAGIGGKEPENEIDLEEVWRLREEEVYPSLFGPQSRGIFTLSQDHFTDFGRQDVAPQWLFYGVIEYAPTDERPSWLYVSSGHSNPWDDAPEEYNPDLTSGAGIEFVVLTEQSDEQAIRLLQHLLAYDLLLRAGHFGSPREIEIGALIPLGNADAAARDGTISHVLATMPESVPSEFQLPSGTVQLVTFVGITEGEYAYGKEKGSDPLANQLKALKNFPLTNFKRKD